MLAYFTRQTKIILSKRSQEYSSLPGHVAVHIGVDTNISKKYSCLHPLQLLRNVGDYIPEDLNIHQHRCKNLNSRNSAQGTRRKPTLLPTHKV